MSNEISRVYQFLAERPDWKTDMDIDGNGTILKSEFSEFMKNEFDWESLEGWNGETSKQTDLINEFWKNIDTTQSGNVTGTNFKNKNALDTKEVTNMNNKIEMYEILNEYTSTLSAPSIISDSSRWKQSVSTSLANLTETFIKNGGKKEDLLSYLESVSTSVQNKTTADCVADEYLNQELNDFMKEYNYSYLEDKTLQNIISNYIQNIPEGSSNEDIKSTVELIIDAYLATAGLKEDNAFDLGNFGYTPNENSQLNELQVSMLTKNLEKEIQSSDLSEQFNNNNELYTSAITSYISTLKFGDFYTVSNNLLESFKASNAYKDVQNTITAKNILTSEDFYNKLSEISESLAEKVKNDGRYLDIMDDLETALLNKVKAGEFNDNNGTINEEEALNWLIEQVKSNLDDFFPNGLGDMSVIELNNLYNTLVEAANNMTDDDESLKAHRDAAIKYCDALTTKSPKLKEMVTNAFGDSYKTTINKLYPSEINEKIQELQQQAAQYGDPKDLTLKSSSWGIQSSAMDLETSKNSAINLIKDKLQDLENQINSASFMTRMRLKIQQRNILNELKNTFGSDDYASAINNMDANSLVSAMQKVNNLFQTNWEPSSSSSAQTISNITISQGDTETFNIAPAFTDKNGNDVVVTSDRITYKSSNTSVATVDNNGTVTFNGNNAGTYTVTLSVYVDGVEVGTNTITVECIKKLDLSTVSTNFESTPISDHIKNGNTAVNLSGFTNMNTAKSNAKSSISTYVDRIVEILTDAGYNASRLQKTATTIINYYNACIDAIYDHGGDSNYEGYNNLQFVYVDADGNTHTEDSKFSQKTKKREADAGRTGAGAETIDHNSTGIRMNESYAGDNTYEFYINVGVLLEKFQKFYNEL